MQRGDLVTVSLQGDYGKPRTALIVQSNLLTDLESIVLCPVTSDLRNAAFQAASQLSCPTQSSCASFIDQLVQIKSRSCAADFLCLHELAHLDSSRRGKPYQTSTAEMAKAARAKIVKKRFSVVVIFSR